MLHHLRRRPGVYARTAQPRRCQEKFSSVTHIKNENLEIYLICHWIDHRSQARGERYGGKWTFCRQLSSMSRPPPPPDGGADSERASGGVDLSCGRQAGEGAQGEAGAGEDQRRAPGDRAACRTAAPIPSCNCFDPTRVWRTGANWIRKGTGSDSRRWRIVRKAKAEPLVLDA
jgi:hypothetical protein